jgi:hypothetical protein
VGVAPPRTIDLPKKFLNLLRVCVTVGNFQGLARGAPQVRIPAGFRPEVALSFSSTEPLVRSVVVLLFCKFFPSACAGFSSGDLVQERCEGIPRIAGAFSLVLLILMAIGREPNGPFPFVGLSRLVGSIPQPVFVGRWAGAQRPVHFYSQFLYDCLGR